MKLTSSAFADGELIPARYTCGGENISPPLAWSGAPLETRAYVLVCEDPDAPDGTWDHWLLYNIPEEVTSLPAGQDAVNLLFGKASHGLNSWRRATYGGPCPPPGPVHRYFFRIYALYAPVDLPAGATKEELTEAMAGLILSYGTLVGTCGH
jgi:Raf kinase inhibitor-like YbhB/YbcL family protein